MAKPIPELKELTRDEFSRLSKEDQDEYWSVLELVTIALSKPTRPKWRKEDV